MPNTPNDEHVGFVDDDEAIAAALENLQQTDEGPTTDSDTLSPDDVDTANVTAEDDLEDAEASDVTADADDVDSPAEDETETDPLDDLLDDLDDTEEDEEQQGDDEADTDDTEDEDVDADEAETESGVVELDNDATVVVDGEEMAVDDFLEIKAALTRKTQEYSQQVKDLQQQLDESAEKAEDLDAILMDYQTDPVGTAAQFLTNAKNVANKTDVEEAVALTITDLVVNGNLGKQWLSVLDLDEDKAPEVLERYRNRAADARETLGLVQERDTYKSKAEQFEQQQTVKQQTAQLQQEWQTLVSDKSLTDAQVDVLGPKVAEKAGELAEEMGKLPPLKVAYDLVLAEELQARKSRTKKRTSKRNKTRAVPKGNGRARSSEPRRVPKNDDEAVALALQ